MLVRQALRRTLHVVLAALPVAIAGYLVLFRDEELERWAGSGEGAAVEVIRAIAYVVPLLIVLAAWRSRQGRVLVAAVTVANTAIALELARTLGTEADLAALIPWLALVASVSATLIAPMRGRGVITSLGVFPVLLLVALHVATSAVLVQWPEVLSRVSLPVIPQTPIPWIALAPLTCAVLLQARLRKGDDGHRLLPSLALALLAVFAALGSAAGAPSRLSVPLAATVFLIAAAGCLAVGLEEVLRPGDVVDVLTGLPGRRALSDALEGLGGTYSIALVDVDGLESLRSTGDAVDDALRLVAKELQEEHVGTVFRQGGGEFVLACAGKELPDVLGGLERLRAAVTARPFVVRQRHSVAGLPPPQLSLTVSIGAAERSLRHPRAVDVLRAADEAVRRARRKGGNRVEAERRTLPEGERRAKTAKERAGGWLARFRR